MIGYLTVSHLILSLLIESEQKIDVKMLVCENGKNINPSLTGTPAVQGDVAVAALDSELVELYRARPELGNEGSLRDSDETE